MTTITAYQNANKVVLLSKLEVTENVDPVPTITADAFLCSALDIKPVVVTLERDNYSPSLSKDKVGTGRINVQLTFTHELKASGTVGLAPKIGTLLQACGFAQTTVAAGASTQLVTLAGATNTGPTVTLAKTTAPTGTLNIFDKYRLYITTGGGTGVAKGMWLSDGFPAGDTTVSNSLDFTQYFNTAAGTAVVSLAALAAVTIVIGGTWATGDIFEMNVFGAPLYYVVLNTDTTNTILAASIAAAITAMGEPMTAAAATGTITLTLTGAATPFTLTTAVAITLGASGAQITPSWAGNLVVGDFYDTTLLRAGVQYTPVSNNIPSATFYIYLDGTLHKVTGCRGTFKVDGKASDYAKLAFTFTGQYLDPIDGALPTGMVYEQSKPVKCELMQFTVKNLPNNFGQTWSLDLGGVVSLREDYNATDGVLGTLFTDRKPILMCDPESTNPSKYNIWKRLQYSDIIRVYCKIGQRAGAGNLVHIQADAAQYDKVDYKDRNKIRTWDAGFRLARQTDNGDDEMSFWFT